MAAPARPTYPPLKTTGEAVQRARYWYSGGPRLDQGPTSAVVGFVWTHWLHDRGLRADVPFDDAYARELFAASQQVAGIEDETGGSFVWAAEQVVRDRGLIAESYACLTIEAVLEALLTRGPVVAALTVSGDLTPVWVDGRAVWLMPEETPRGGHAVLLNGVDLDLGLGGERGFVRLKNSWGAGWGDDGQALMSIEDLGRALEFEETLLPVPAPDALVPGGSTEIADPEAPPGGYGPQSIGSDLWTTVDTVGYASYAEAIARGIQHEETAPPLTIGIKAPWGAGKTSLMRMIRDRLEWPSGRRAAQPRPLHLAGRSRDETVTNRTLLEYAQAEQGAELRAQDDEERRWRPTVWFNPWMYQTGEQVWAGLAHEIITQITERMPRMERERFWLELNVRRVDEQAVRRRIYALVLQRLVPWAIAALVVVVIGLGLLAVNAIAGAVAIAGGPAALAAVAWAQLRSVMETRPTGALAKLVAPATDQIIRSPDYAGQTGFFYLLQADLQRVLDLVATPRRPLVVFVDDLDRCAPGTVVQVIEAINLFLAGQYPNCIFVIAMEPDMVAAHVEAAYGTLAQRFEGEFDLGWRFLEKIVQLPLTLPALEPERAAGFAESLFGAATEPERPPEEKSSAAELREIDTDIGGGNILRVAGMVTPGTEGADVVRRAVERRLTIEDREVKQAVAYAARFLDANPREIKRFVNIFRFLVMIHTERAIEGLATTATLDQLAKLALVSTRWPALMSALARPLGSGTVFELLEGPDKAALKALETATLPAAVKSRLVAEPLITLLRAEPRVGAAARHYL